MIHEIQKDFVNILRLGLPKECKKARSSEVGREVESDENELLS